MKALLCKINAMLTAVATGFRPLLLLFIRLYWGWQCFLTGRGKLSDLSRPTQFFASLHLPAPHANALVVSLSEPIGGILIMLGLGTRWLTPLLIFEMVIAYVTADQEALRSILSDPDKFT